MFVGQPYKGLIGQHLGSYRTDYKGTVRGMFDRDVGWKWDWLEI